MLHPEDRVLVCLINRARDLEIARWDHWYRVPTRSAPREPLPDVLAFFLTAEFGDEKWAISEYARVRGHELVRRVDLFPAEPAHPRAQETYLKYQLGPLERLPRPIPSLRWRRVTFLATTGERLMQALEVGDLAEDKGHLKLMDEGEE
ncbi:MAG: hypothetical protein K1X39_05045 [Thermoflexales bacterium]|nr:hypothetical protein [Thermoflexales bacterium]